MIKLHVNDAESVNTDNTHDSMHAFSDVDYTPKHTRTDTQTHTHTHACT